MQLVGITTITCADGVIVYTELPGDHNVQLNANSVDLVKFLTWLSTGDTKHLYGIDPVVCAHIANVLIKETLDLITNTLEQAGIHGIPVHVGIHMLVLYVNSNLYENYLVLDEEPILIFSIDPEDVCCAFSIDGDVVVASRSLLDAETKLQSISFNKPIPVPEIVTKTDLIGTLKNLNDYAPITRSYTTEFLCVIEARLYGAKIPKEPTFEATEFEFELYPLSDTRYRDLNYGYIIEKHDDDFIVIGRATSDNIIKPLTEKDKQCCERIGIQHRSIDADVNV